MSKFTEYLNESTETVKVRDDFGNNYTIPKNQENKFNQQLNKIMKEQDNELKFPSLKKTFLKVWQQYRTSK